MLAKVTALLSVISIVVSLALGLTVVMALWPRKILRATPFQIALSFGVGFGAWSGILLGSLVVIAELPSRGFVLTEMAVIILVAWAALRRKRSSEVPTHKTASLGAGRREISVGKRDSNIASEGAAQQAGYTAGRPYSFADGVSHSHSYGVSRSVLWGAAAVLTIGACCVVVRIVTAPHGDWDAWASWNMKARMIYLGGDHWRDVFSVLLPDAVPEYPLLLPLSVVASWLTVGSPAPIAPALLAGAFTCATVLMLGSGLSILRGKSQGLLAAALLAATPSFIIHATSQYADVPIAFFFLATLVLLAMYDQDQDPRLMILAGLTAGLAAWTKNEGLVFLIVVAVSRLVLTRRRTLFWYLAGATPALILVVYLKTALATASNQITAGQGLHATLERLADASRYRIIGSAVLAEFTHLGNWPVSILLLLFLYAVVQGVRAKSERGPAMLSLSVTMALMLAAYFSVYLITPFDLQFHLQVSLSRLIVQVWPSALFVYFLAVRTPEEARFESRSRAWLNGRKRLMLLSPALILLACVWASGGTLLALWKTRGLPYETNLMAYERKLSGIRSLLPDRGVIGYTTDDGPLREFFWTQYFLAPLIVVRSGEPELVVLNRHNADAAESNDQRGDQSYAVEEHYGMKLYDFGTGIYLEDRRAMQR